MEHRISVTFEAIMGQFNSDIRRGVDRAKRDIAELGTNLSQLSTTGNPTGFMDEFNESVSTGTVTAANDLGNIENKVPGGMNSVGKSMGTNMMTGFVAGIKVMAAAAVLRLKANFGKFLTTNFFKAPAKSAIEFERVISSVGTKANATAQEMEMLADKAREVGGATQFTLIEVAQAMEKMALAGFTTEQMMSAIGPTMDLAAASGESLDVAARAVTDGLTTFGLSAEETARLTDVLAVTATNSNTTIAELSKAFTFAGATAREFGFEIEDVALTLGLMANAGIRGGRAGRALRAAMLRVTNDVSGARTAITDLGVELVDLYGNIKPLTEIFEDLRVAMMQLDDVARIQAATAIAGTEHQAAFLNVISATVDEIYALESAIADANGAAARMAYQMNDNVAGSMMRVNSQMEVFRERIGNQLLPVINDVLNALLLMMSYLDNTGRIDALADSIANLSYMIGDLLISLIAMLPTIIDLTTNLFNLIAVGIARFLPAIETIVALLDKVLWAINAIIEAVIAVTTVIAILFNAVAVAFWYLIAQIMQGIANVVAALADLLSWIPMIGRAFEDLSATTQRWADHSVGQMDRVIGRTNALINSLRIANNEMAAVSGGVVKGPQPAPGFQRATPQAPSPALPTTGGGGASSGGGAGRNTSTGGGGGGGGTTGPQRTQLQQIQDVYRTEIAVMQSRKALAKRTGDTVALEAINETLYETLGNKLDDINNALYSATDQDERNMLEVAANQISLQMLDVMESINNEITTLVGSFNKPGGLTPLTEYAFLVATGENVSSNTYSTVNNIEMHLKIENTDDKAAHHMADSTKRMLNTFSDDMLNDVSRGSTGAGIY